MCVKYDTNVRGATCKSSLHDASVLKCCLLIFYLYLIKYSNNQHGYNGRPLLFNPVSKGN